MSHLNLCVGAVEHVQHDNDGDDVVGAVQVVVDHLRQRVRVVELDAAEVGQSK